MKLSYQAFLRKFDGCDKSNNGGTFIPQYGASMSPKEKGTLRLATQNSRGMDFGSSREGYPALNMMKTKEIDALGLTETNRYWSSDACGKLRRMMLMDGPGRLTAASDPSPKEGYLPDGCLLMMWGQQTGRTFKCHTDKQGRFCYMTLQVRDSGGIVIINVYRVSQHKGTKAGPNTSYIRQYDAM